MTMRSCRIPATVDDEEEKKMADVKEQAWNALSRYRERIGEAAFKRYVVEKVLEEVETPGRGDESISFGENGFEPAAQRVNAREMFDEKSGLFYDECAANSVVGLLINKLRVGAAEVNMNELDMVGVKSGVLREEEQNCIVLYEECAKAAADLCIMKMRFGPLVDKLDKRAIVEAEIAEAKRIYTNHMAFVKADEVTRKQDSEANAPVQDNDVGAVVMDDMMIEMAKMAAFVMDGKMAAFENESLRVLVEMMKGVRTGEKRGQALDEAMELICEWTAAKMVKCVIKMVLGILVDRQSIDKALWSGIVEDRMMEKEVHDRFVIFRMKHGHLLESCAAEKNSKDGIVIGDQRKRLIERLGLGWGKDLALLLPPIVVGIFAAFGAVWQKDVLLLLVPTVVGVSLLWLD